MDQTRTTLIVLLACCIAASVLCAGAPAISGPTERSELPTLFVVGDSTASNGADLGWGSDLGSYFDPGKINVENRAWGGTSSRTFQTQGFWDKVLADLKPGDYVMMQFGHNDSSPINDRQRARGTIPGVGDETQEIDNLLTGKHETVHTYGWYVCKFISDAKTREATAIVCSPIPRDNWRDGKVVRASNDYGPWAAAAARRGGAFFLDLNTLIADRYDRLGEKHVSATFFGPQDHTHTVAAGAKFNGQCVVDGLKAIGNCPLADYLRGPPGEDTNRPQTTGLRDRSTPTGRDDGSGV